MSDRDGTLHLYVMNGDGSGQVRLTKNPGLERSPSWSNDGKKLVFSYSADKKVPSSEIYSINSDGNGLTRLTNNNVEDNAPALSPDGQLLTWSQIGTGGIGAVWVAKSDGSGAHQLSLPREFARTPSFDPQGRVVFVAKVAGNPGAPARYQIMRANPDGTGRVQLSSGTSNLNSPVVSPDGSTLIFTDDASGDFRLSRSPVDSFAPTPLAGSVAGDDDPRWTPDGRLVFSSVRDGNPGHPQIYSCNADGSSPRRLTKGASINRFPAAR